MAAIPRVHFPGALYNVISRGKQRQELYRKGIATISESALWRVILNVESRLMPDHVICLTQCKAVWIAGFLLMLGIIGCERGSNAIDYRGEKIKLTKAYTDYDEYKNDPENIDPSETERVQRLVLAAPIAKTFGSRVEASKAIGQIAFPGYGSGGFIEQSQADGSVLMGFSVEIPRANKERVFCFSRQGRGVYAS